ncbi:hypothetical protein CCR84_09455 [Rhodocyclus purpureus]|nr:TIGR02270 family protein [Rhodocyclus purpureus]MBK5914538.1 hypothetical protein [Rhodocyclus purpureus]
MPNSVREILPSVVNQHVVDAVGLRCARTSLTTSTHVNLVRLGRTDERIAANLDGVAVAGAFGSQIAQAALESPGRGEIFLTTVRALDERKADGVYKLFAVAVALPQAMSGVLSAFGWVSAASLKGIVGELLSSPDPFRQRIGIAACSLHRVDPGPLLSRAIADPDVALRARALRCAGEVGRLDLLPDLALALKDEDAECRFRAAQSAVLLGDRSDALAMLGRIASQPGPFRIQAQALALFAHEAMHEHELIVQLARQHEDVHSLIRAVGFAGDARRIPWLIGLMADDKLARIAGESFSFITGADLACLDLERKPPENFESGPNDNPEDEDVAMDEDDGLPWPDQAKVQAWWSANSQRFPPGARHFVGAPPSWAHCIEVLKTGYQRQRFAAAQHLCLLRPGTPLFNCAAPAWRQQRLLARMS